jgi:Resolvase, N terminal domain
VVAAVDHALKAVAQSRARAELPRDSTSIAVNDDAHREGLERVLDQLRPGDTLLVWKLDRLGRSLRHFVDTVTGLAERGIGCRSLQDRHHDAWRQAAIGHAVLRYLSLCLLPPDGHSVRSDRDEGGLQVPRYLLINGTEPRWRLHDTIHSADLDKSLARVMENGATTYTLASRNEGETFQSLTINGKTLVSYVITEEDDPDPAKTRSRYEATGF